MLHHVPLQVAGLGEGLVAHLTFVGPHALVCEQVCVQVAQLLEQLPTQVAAMRLNAVVPQNVCDQVVFGGVGFFTHATLPPLLVASHVYVVTVVHVHAQTQLLSAGRSSSRGPIAVPMSGAEVLSGVEGARREVHDRTGHEEGIREEAVMQRREVGRV